MPREPLNPPLFVTKEQFEDDDTMWAIVTSKAPAIIKMFHMNGFELDPRIDPKTNKVPTINLAKRKS